jgi:hypothetical protein
LWKDIVADIAKPPKPGKIYLPRGYVATCAWLALKRRREKEKLLLVSCCHVRDEFTELQ